MLDYDQVMKVAQVLGYNPRKPAELDEYIRIIPNGFMGHNEDSFLPRRKWRNGGAERGSSKVQPVTKWRVPESDSEKQTIRIVFNE